MIITINIIKYFMYFGYGFFSKKKWIEEKKNYRKQKLRDTHAKVFKLLLLWGFDGVVGESNKNFRLIYNEAFNAFYIFSIVFWKFNISSFLAINIHISISLEIGLDYTFCNVETKFNCKLKICTYVGWSYS